MTKKPATENVEKLVDEIKSNNDRIKIGSVTYQFHKFVHKERVRVFGFLTSVAPVLSTGNFSFLSSEEFERIEKIISSNVTIEGMSLSKMENHWDEYPENFIKFYTTALQFISYPFLSGGITA